MNISTETCPPLEDIAAFLDGKLSGEERARIVAHLAECESCYTLFADAARFQLEEGKEAAAEPAKAAVVPFPRKRVLRWALPLAAMLLVGVATIPLYRQYNEMPDMFAAQLVDLSALKNVPSDRLWSNDKRSGSKLELTDSQPAEFMLGAHLVDLRVILARNDAQESVNVLARINRYIESLLFADEQAQFYLKVQAEIVDGKREPKELLAEATATEASLTEITSYSLAFGKWVEASRLSALARKPEFFEDRRNRQFLLWLLRKQDEDLDPRVLADLLEVREVLETNALREPQYRELAERLSKILDNYQNRAEAG